MTTQRSFKARVRARMEKTGESYTTARRHLISRAAEPASTAASPPAPTEPTATAAAAQTERIADDLIRARTGRGWAEWFALLDAASATGWTHTRIARHLATEHEVPGWWAQTVTVGYEQARGLRASAPPPRRAASGPTGPVAPPGSSSASTLSASRRPGSASCTRS
ncbi:DUF4287 domain-containing protein [Micromonospora sp. NPDC051227]|uniref:DUF4287 domain-containing protein n=1 Tax=Micromonospora sp. NPDC051227 TaxID=3364285 RepID=UPI001931CBAC|nr:hypothetical protein [Micromonospora sp. STR1s_5]